MKKTIIILLTALLAFSVFVACNQDTIVDDLFNGGSEPGPALVEILYIDADTTTLLGGRTYTIASDVTNLNRLSIKDNAPVTILLPDGMTLNLQKGITVSEGQTLVIDKYGLTEAGSGILNAIGSEESAGIGGCYGGKCGTVTINGGTVNATGGSSGGAGIGGGSQGDGGNVIINGGTVFAAGGSPEAYAIGKGSGGSSPGRFKNASDLSLLCSSDNISWSYTIAFFSAPGCQYVKVL